MNIDINQAGIKTGRTALHFATKNGHLEVTKTLIASGANIDVMDNNGDTPLALAIQGKHEEVIRQFSAMTTRQVSSYTETEPEHENLDNKVNHRNTCTK
jgi:ankyrin repeat protein